MKGEILPKSSRTEKYEISSDSLQLLSTNSLRGKGSQCSLSRVTHSQRAAWAPERVWVLPPHTDSTSLVTHSQQERALWCCLSVRVRLTHVLNAFRVPGTVLGKEGTEVSSHGPFPHRVQSNERGRQAPSKSMGLSTGPLGNTSNQV